MRPFQIFTTIALSMLTFTACNEEVKEKIQMLEYPNGARRSAKSYEVTKKYGPLTIREGEYSGEAKMTPWSTWWYPLNEKTLFQGTDNRLSTLEKYDHYAANVFGERAQAAKIEEQEIYKPSEVGWAGLCHAWAIAAVLHPEPKREKQAGGLNWSIADQKALLLKSYETATGISQIMYGGRYTGAREDDYDDIYPDQFHKLAQDHLIEKKKPFLLDYEARHPVWTVPAYKIKFIIKKQDEESALVSAWLSFASPHVKDLNFVGIKRIVKNYTYMLYGKWKNGVMAVNDGKWIEASKDDHPDYVISYPDSIQRGSNNTELKMTIIDSILK